MNWDALETPLDQEPAFFVEAPDGRKHWREIERQVEFRRLMRMAAPRVLVFANANAGKRNPMQAKREGIRAGVLDMTVLFRPPLAAWIEFKGYDKRGTAGKLSQAQIDFGNRLAELGIPCGCFFDPLTAVNFLRAAGFQIAEAPDAA